MPHSQKAKTYNRKYCNKFNEDFKNGPPQKKYIKRKEKGRLQNNTLKKTQFQLIQLNTTKRKTTQSKNGQKT